MMKLLFFFSVLPVLVFGQTAVVAKMTRDAIYLGADSRSTLIRDDPKTGKADTTFYNTYCKIKKVGKYYIAMVNWFASASVENARKAAVKTKNFEEFTILYARTFVDVLSGKLGVIYSQHKSYFNRIYPTGGVLCHTICFGYDGNVGKLSRATFTNLEVSDGKVIVGTTIRNGNAITAGHVDEILADVEKLKKGDEDPSKIIYSLIKRQCRNQSVTVGEPINLIKVTKAGHKWVYNGCNLNSKPLF